MSDTGKKFKGPRREWRLLSADEAAAAFLAARGGKERLHLTALWENWTMVMGDTIASLGAPLGHKEHTLTIGADDSMALQELSMQSIEIIERANAFMDSEYFQRVKVLLTQGRQDLSNKRPRRSTHSAVPAIPPRPSRLGGLVGRLAPDSPVTRCYEAYIRLYRNQEL